MGMKLSPIHLIAAFALALTPVRADEAQFYSEGRYDDRLPEFKFELQSPYLLDPVNRRSSLTPELVWRSMFPSIQERITNEQRVFGVGGQAERELRWWQDYPR